MNQFKRERDKIINSSILLSQEWHLYNMEVFIEFIYLINVFPLHFHSCLAVSAFRIYMGSSSFACFTLVFRVEEKEERERKERKEIGKRKERKVNLSQGKWVDSQWCCEHQFQILPILGSISQFHKEKGTLKCKHTNVVFSGSLNCLFTSLIISFIESSFSKMDGLLIETWHSHHWSDLKWEDNFLNLQFLSSFFLSLTWPSMGPNRFRSPEIFSCAFSKNRRERKEPQCMPSWCCIKK